MREVDEQSDLMETVKSWFRADQLISNVPYFILLTALGIIYIANAHYHLQLERKIDKKETELKELSWEYMTVKSQVMYQSKQSEVAKKVEVLGLRPLTDPPKIIEINHEH